MSGLIGRPVLDQTGLTGRYDFALLGTHTPEALPADLREKLGLQLDAVTAPINVIVVDDVHEPTVDVQPPPRQAWTHRHVRSLHKRQRRVRRNSGNRAENAHPSLREPAE
jgi:hypothetical protein